MLVGAAIIAANLPDIDLAYSFITRPPLGYLLHHRGHTHTFAGLGVLAVVVIAAYWSFPSLRKMRASGRIQFGLLVAAALGSHLALDSLNNYGVHPFYPKDNAWYYGDALFIFEPSLWLIFGIAVAANARSRTTRLASTLPMLILLFAMVSTGIAPLMWVAVLASVGVAFAAFAWRASPRVRAAGAFLVCGSIVAGLVGTSGRARRDALDALGTELQGRVADLVLTPNPSSPLCWGVIAIETREREYVVWRGTLSLAPAWTRPVDCASHRFVDVRPERMIGNGRFALRDEIHQPLEQLRTLARNDCRVRAWLRFGRVPIIDGEWIFDLRYSERVGRNFSHMRLAAARDCPAHVPGWSMPRTDLITSR
jgi:inner membrane protein